MPTRRRPSLILLAVVTSLCGGPALAHDGAGLAGGFVSGALHPITGPDHLLAMVAVGLWGAFLGRPLVYLLPVVFPLVTAAGGVLGMVGAPFPPVELGVAASVLVLGLMVAAAVRAPVWAACLLVAAFALFHGYAHGAELPAAADPLGYSLGFVLATGLLHLLGVGLGLLRARRGGEPVLRGLGAAVAACGVFFIGAAVAIW